jgi:hypothetical protein
LSLKETEDKSDNLISFLTIESRLEKFTTSITYSSK